MLKKEPIITIKKQLKIYIDDCYFDYSELLIHVLNKIENFSFYVLDKSSLNIKKSMSKNANKSYKKIILRETKNMESLEKIEDLDERYSKNEIRKLENNTFYILNKDYYNLGSNRERTIYFSTSKPCNCYISNIRNVEKSFILVFKTVLFYCGVKLYIRVRGVVFVLQKRGVSRFSCVHSVSFRVL